MTDEHDKTTPEVVEGHRLVSVEEGRAEEAMVDVRDADEVYVGLGDFDSTYPAVYEPESNVPLPDVIRFVADTFASVSEFYPEHEDDAGYDLRAYYPDPPHHIIIRPGARALIGTGIRLAIPQGHAGFVMPRSGLALRHGVTVLNAPGLIDSGYRGEVGVVLHNTSTDPFVVHHQDRIAQIVFVRLSGLQVVPVEELDETERGENGFGSTGV